MTGRSFNSLFEILEQVKMIYFTNIYLPFNSLFEILKEADEIVAKIEQEWDFQFSFWDSPARHPQRPDRVPPFQFSFWDSKAESSYQQQKVSILSILFLRFLKCTFFCGRGGIENFQFSFWDSDRRITRGLSNRYVALSILFLRF